VVSRPRIESLNVVEKSAMIAVRPSDDCSSLQLPKAVLFAKLNAKLRGYYQYYGIRGNFESLADFYHHMRRLLFRTLNRRSQRRSYNWKGFAELLQVFRLERPRICHDF